MDLKESYDPGEVVIEEGTQGTSAYIILSGTAEVTKRSGDRTISMATLGRGQVFGEMGLIEDRPRSATIRALSKLKVRVIDRENFNRLLRSRPTVLIPIMKFLFERLRRTTQMLAERTPDTAAEASVERAFEVVMKGETREAKKVLENRPLVIKKSPFLIGRYSTNPEGDVFYNNDLSIKEQKPYVVSRNHLAIIHEGERMSVLDRGSAFGTIVNGKEIGGLRRESRAPLDKEKNQIILGPEISPYVFSLKIRLM